MTCEKEKGSYDSRATSLNVLTCLFYFSPGGMGMGGGAQSPGVLGSLIGRPSSAQSTVSEPYV